MGANLSYVAIKIGFESKSEILSAFNLKEAEVVLRGKAVKWGVLPRRAGF